MSKAAFDRLRKEFVRLQKNPPDHIEATPLDSDILTWHYVITGPADSPYAGGVYHGKLLFPPQYPFKPPGIQMCTPSGRFKVDTRLCLSMSDFHPETWNPLWSVSSILSGLLSFMLESTPTQGSVEPATSDAVKREYAARSLEYNLRNPTFKKLFPKYAKADGQEEDEDDKQESEEAGAGAGAGVAALDLKATAAPAAAGSTSPSADEAQAADYESASAASAVAAPAAAAAAPVAAPAPAAAAAAGGGPVKVLQLGALGSIRADQLYDFALALIALLAVGAAAVLCALR